MDMAHQSRPKKLPPARAALIEMRITEYRARFELGAIEEIQAAVCAVFDVALADLLGDSRYRQHSEARHASFFLCREAAFSFPAIGEAHGKDHSSVQHGVHAATDLIATDRRFSARVNAVRIILKEQRDRLPIQSQDDPSSPLTPLPPVKS
jgi:chromosomal replication initiation ATPase DnaA